MYAEKLIELVRSYPVLYDSTHSKYMDTRFKSTIWKEISKEMNTDALSCKARWNNIRDNYRKSLKKTTNNSKHVRLYKYADRLEFLQKYFGEKNNKEVYKNLEDTAECEIDIEEHELKGEIDIYDEGESSLPDEDEDVLDNLILEDDTQEVSRRSRKSVSSEESMPCKLFKNSELFGITNHSVDAFLAGIGATLKALHPYYLNLAKGEIFAIAQKYEMKMIINQYPDVKSYSNEKRLSESRMNQNVQSTSKYHSNTTTRASTPIITPEFVEVDQQNHPTTTH